MEPDSGSDLSAPSDQQTQVGDVTATSPENTDVTAVGSEQPTSYDQARALQRGDTVGRYVITAALGQGGMGVVYAAYDPELDRKLAIKLLHPDRRGSLGTSAGQQRLLREARAMAKLTHPNVVTVHDVGTFDRAVFVAMEYVEGRTLGAWMKQAPRNWRDVVGVFVEAGQGLEAAHAAGLVHRDFKPDNVMLEDATSKRRARVLVMDFGLARAAEDEPTTEVEVVTGPAAPPASADLAISDKLTRTGAAVGTPAYMAPEQHLGQAASAAADQFSFCVALYEALYGERPFAGETMAAVACAVTEGEIRPPPSGTKVPPWLRRVVVRGLSVAPSGRWPGMTALLEALQRDPARRRRHVAVAVVATGVTAAAGVAAYRGLTSPPATAVCTGAEASFDEVWGASRGDALQAAFTDNGGPLGAETWTRVESTVDELRTAWIEQYVDACEATNVRQTQSQELMDRRMACLERRLDELDATGRVFEDVDAESSRSAVRAISRIRTRLDQCADVERLTASIEPPGDPETAARVEAVRAKVALAEAQTMRDPKLAAATAQEAVDEAEATGYEPVLAEALARAGQIAQDDNRLDEAEALIKRAHYTARGAGHDRISAEAAAELMAFYIDDRADLEQADHWQEQAAAEVRRYGKDTDVEARYLDNLGTLHLRHGDNDASIEAHRRALAIWKRVDGPQQLDVAVSEYGLGNGLFMAGEVSESIERYRRALEIWEKELGPGHPLVAEATSALGNAHHRLARYDEAEAFYRRALDIQATTYGEQHPNVAGPLNGIALCHEARGELDAAIETHRRVLDIVAEGLGDHHPFTASTHNNLGGVLRAAGHFDEALREHEAALAARIETLGADHPVVSESETDVAVDLVELGRPDEAIAHAERGLKIREDGGAGPKNLAESRFALARALWDANRSRNHARELAESALQAASTQPDLLREMVDEIESWIAEHR